MAIKQPSKENFLEGIDNPATIPGFDTLSEREARYFRIMYAQSGVLYLTSEPGIAKSAIMRSIARKLGFQYFDIRLSMVDETDVGLFPVVSTITLESFVEGVDPFGKGNISVIDRDAKQEITIQTLKHVVPEWAILANNKPSIIHFEELNRSTLQVRNAALQLLLEREIGAFFGFSENVYMCSSGNLGEEDGTDVEEFDQALNNRLIHYRHEMPIQEWKEQFAEEHVHPMIVGFLTHGGATHYYKKNDERNAKSKAYATPRSWTFLSDYIFRNYGRWEEEVYGRLFTKRDGPEKQQKPTGDLEGQPTGRIIRRWAPVRTWLSDIEFIGASYVGASAAPFTRYVRDTLKISLDDILKRFDSLEDEILQFTRDKKSELLANMRERKVCQLKPDEAENLIKFLGTISEDECIAYLLHVLDNEYALQDEGKDNKTSERFLSDDRFEQYRQTVFGHVSTPNDKDKK